MSTSDEEQDSLEGTDPIMHSVVLKHGRDLYATTFSLGIAREAAERATQVMTKHQSRKGLEALGTLLDAFNAISSAYVVEKGWSAEKLAEVDRDIQLAWAGKVQVPGGKLVLDS